MLLAKKHITTLLNRILKSNFATINFFMRKLKLIWDFRGPTANKTAEHHDIHLKEYIKNKGLESFAGYEVLSSMHAIAFMVVNEDEMKPIRDALKPHRGQVYTH